MELDLSSAGLRFLIISLISIDFSAFAVKIKSSPAASLWNKVPITIWCNITDRKWVEQQQQLFVVNWKKNNVQLDVSESQKYFIASPAVINGTNQQNLSLTLRSNNVTIMGGKYRCEVVGTGDKKSESPSIMVYMPPTIATRTVSHKGNYHYLPSIDKIAGDVAKLECAIVAYPPVAVYHWSNSRGKELNSSTSTLTLNNLHTDDRDDYYCYGANSYGNITLIQLVRVKSRFAPLWPAIGIIAIMIALVVIIVITERRRKAKEAEDKDK